MRDYRQMAIRYIYNNKKRAVLGIAGITISVGLLFVFLNSVETLLAKWYGENIGLIPEGNLGESVYTLRLSAWFVAYLFTILGVGVVRNAIQLLLMDQIKDFGLLRCVGATKAQLKSYIYTIGFTLEGIGLTCGYIIGYISYRILAGQMKWDAHFYGIAFFIILIAFLGDMVFAMEDCAKVIKHMTPVDAVRGKYRIREEKIRIRGKSIWGFLFGVEGDYAAKSLKRNPRRYIVSVVSVGMGIAAICLVVAFESMFTEFVVDDGGKFGTYQFGLIAPANVVDAEDMQTNYVLSEETVKKISQQPNVKKGKPVHSAILNATDVRVLSDHIMNDFAKSCIQALDINIGLVHLESEYEGTANMQVATDYLTQINLFGYDAEDYGRLKKYITAGTTELSENGVILVGGTSVVVENDDTLNDKQMVMQMTDYQVGDTIEVVDFQSYYQKLQASLPEYGEENYLLKKVQAKYDCYQECITEGLTKTLTIEGIVETDPNIAILVDSYGTSVEIGYEANDCLMRLIVPVDRFVSDTGLSEDYPCGTVFSMTGKDNGNLLDIIYNNLPPSVVGLRVQYLRVLGILKSFRYVLLGFAIAIAFIILMNLLNIINITFSNMYLRRTEFAQLRVLGMSEKRLLYTVLLEGVITAIGAALVGLALGYGALYLVKSLVNLIYYMECRFPWEAYIGAAAAGLVLLCVCVFTGVKSAKMSMVDSLAGNE